MKNLRLNTCSEQSESNGFTLIEIMIAIVILSVALLSMASTTVTVIKGNQISNRVTEAVALAQDTIEDLRNKNFYLGTNGTLEIADNADAGTDAVAGTADDPISSELKNSNTGNDNTTAAAALFASPDHAYQLDANNNETTAILDSPALTTSASFLRRAWVIKDNTALNNTKTVTVVVGWNEAGSDRYVSVSTVIAGTRYSGLPGTI